MIAVVSLGALLGVAWWTLQLGEPTQAGGERLLIWYAVGWVSFALAALSIRHLARPRAVVLIVAGGLALQMVAVSFPPTTTDDFYRYIWDGKVQAAGINPYRHPPLDPALTHLRDEFLFPPPAQAAALVAHDPERGYIDVCTYLGQPHDCTRINRPTVRTIYLPVAEAAFLGLHYLSPHSHRQISVQLFTAALAVLITFALMWGLRRTGRDPRWAVLWAWCPTVWLECGNNGHIDVLGVLLLVLAFGVLAAATNPTARRAAAVGVLFGAAVAVKIVPVLAGPALLARRAPIVLGAAAGVLALGYLPHVLAVGSAVIGYLPGYLQEEGYSGRTRFAVPGLVLPDRAGPVVAATILAALAAVVWRRSDRRPPALGAIVLAGTAFVLVGPAAPWYGLLLVALATLAARPEWLAVAAAAYLVYQAPVVGVTSFQMQQRAYLPAALLVVVVIGVRWWRGRSGQSGCEQEALTPGDDPPPAVNGVIREGGRID